MTPPRLRAGVPADGGACSCIRHQSSTNRCANLCQPVPTCAHARPRLSISIFWSPRLARPVPPLALLFDLPWRIIASTDGWSCILNDYVELTYCQYWNSTRRFGVDLCLTGGCGLRAAQAWSHALRGPNAVLSTSTSKRDDFSQDRQQDYLPPLLLARLMAMMIPSAADPGPSTVPLVTHLGIHMDGLSSTSPRTNVASGLSIEAHESDLSSSRPAHHLSSSRVSRRSTRLAWHGRISTRANACNSRLQIGRPGGELPGVPVSALLCSEQEPLTISNRPLQESAAAVTVRDHRVRQ
jgi:hypothetical protein